jgi:hypothetical protein
MIKKIITSIIALTKKGQFTGLLPDTRPLSEKKKDYLHEEVSVKGSEEIEWEEKKVYRKFPLRDQSSSMSCVAQSTAKALGIENLLEENKFHVFSATDIYDYRVNKPGEGMIGNDAMQIVTSFGATFENLLPSQEMNERQMNKPVERTAQMISVADTYRAGGYVQMRDGDIEEIAKVLQRGKGVVLFFKFNLGEWGYVPVATDYATNIRHAVIAVDYTIYKGEKSLVVEDSAFKKGSKDGQRIITENFLKKRCFYSGYLLDLKNTRNEGLKKPVYRFERDMVFGEKSNEVKMLQDILKYEGLISPSVESTGYYHNITAKAVEKFQEENNISNPIDRMQLKGRSSRVGPATRKVLNEKYA